MAKGAFYGPWVIRVALVAGVALAPVLMAAMESQFEGPVSEQEVAMQPV